jgi:ribosomal protein S18 acetylase RimI-like enzyme
MTAAPAVQPTIEGHGLTLRPWDVELVRRMVEWGERGFPYHAFDLGRLRRPGGVEAEIERVSQAGPHRHFVACEDGVPVGRVSVNLQDGAGLYLWSVHVPPEYEGRGVCRRMLAALMTSLEQDYPGRPFALNANSFAEHALRAYAALGFEIMDTRWHFDLDLAKELWRIAPEERRPIARHLRFQNGRWEVRTHLMERQPGTYMNIGAGRAPVK